MYACIYLIFNDLTILKMKQKSIMRSLFSLLVMAIAFVANAQEQSDYYVKHGADVTINHQTHYPIMVGVSNVRGKQQVLNDIASSPRCQA